MSTTQQQQPDPNAPLKGFLFVGVLLAIGAAGGILSQHLGLIWR